MAEIEKYWSRDIVNEMRSLDVMLVGDRLTIGIWHDKHVCHEVLDKGQAITRLSSEDLDRLITILQETRHKMTVWQLHDDL